MSDDLHKVWCRADLSPFGQGYVLTIEYDNDNVLSLGRSELLDYVAVMSDALQRARYREAMRRQLRSMGVNDQVAIPMIVDLSDEWPELTRFNGYELRPCVSIDGRPSVQVYHGEAFVVQLAPHNVTEHIAHALAVYANADLDSSYRRFLTGVIQTEPWRAEAAVHNLGEHFPTEDDTPPPRRGGGKRRGRGRR